MNYKNYLVFLFLFFTGITKCYSQKKQNELFLNSKNFELINSNFGLSNNIVFDIYQDKEGYIWMATNNGLNRYDGYRFKTFYQTSDSTSISSNCITKIKEDKDGNLWIATKNGLNIYNSENKNFQRYSASITKFSQIPNFKEQDFYYGSYSKQFWLSKEKDLKIDLERTAYLPELPKGKKPRELLEIDKNTLLIGTYIGLYEYKLDSKRLKEVKLSNATSSLTHQIRSIYQDKNKGIWIGTAGGVFYYDAHKKNFQHLDLEKESDDVVMAMGFTKKGIYVNTLGKELYFKHYNNKTFKKVEFPSSTSSGVKYIWDIKEIPESKYPIWMSTGLGVFCYDPIKNKIKEIKLPRVKKEERESYSILKTNKSFLWITSRRGIHQINKKDGKILDSYFLPINPNDFELGIQKIVNFKNNIFIATAEHGLFLFHKTTKSISQVLLKNNKKKKVTFNASIWDMFIAQDSLWVGTNKGLFKLNEKAKYLQPVIENNHIVFSIVEDNNGLLWMGTDKGLMSYNIKNNSIYFYRKKDGVVNTEFNRKSVGKMYNGKLWFGGVNGITTFNPSQININSVKPEVYITKLKVIIPDSSFVVSHKKRKITLNYNHNTIKIDYIALNYTNSNQNQYKYKMIGYDPSWTSNQSREVRYVQLPKGNYTFHVIAANNDGIWNKVGDKIQIEILPPFWETWWFRGIYITFLGFVICNMYRYRIKRLLAIERMKLRIASDLHDEVGSGLSGIALTSDILEQQYAKGEVKPQLLTRITKNARNLAATLDDIVWLINPEKETLADFLMKSKTLTQELLHNTDIHFDDTISESDKKIMLNSDKKRNLFLFIKEALNNIAKHANAKKVQIFFKLIDSQFYLKIIDDGHGFDTTIKTTRNGLVSLQNRAKFLKGNYYISSNLTKGTEVSLQIKIP